MNENKEKAEYWATFGVMTVFLFGYFLSTISMPALPLSGSPPNQAEQLSYGIALGLCGMGDLLGVPLMILCLWLGYIRARANGRRDFGRRLAISGVLVIWLTPLYQKGPLLFDQQNIHTQIVTLWWVMHTIACAVGANWILNHNWKSEAAPPSVSVRDELHPWDSITIGLSERINLGKTVRINNIPWQKKADQSIFSVGVLYGTLGLYHYGLISSTFPLYWGIGLLLAILLDPFVSKPVMINMDGISIKGGRQSMNWSDVGRIVLGFGGSAIDLPLLFVPSAILMLQSNAGDIIQLNAQDRAEAIANIASYYSKKNIEIFTADKH